MGIDAIIVGTDRATQHHIPQDLPSKIVLLTGPRQRGKTTLAKQLTGSFDYLNYDTAESRMILQVKSWDRSKALIIFDDLHKMKQQKRWLNGVYDTEVIPPQIIVSGSARLNTYRKLSDSLAGLFFNFARILLMCKK